VDGTGACAARWCRAKCAFREYGGIVATELASPGPYENVATWLRIQLERGERDARGCGRHRRDRIGGLVGAL